MHDFQGTGDGLTQVDVFARHGFAVKAPLRADNIHDVVRLAVDAFNRAAQFPILLDEVSGQSQQKRPHLLALRVVLDVVAPILRMLLDGL